jgi:2-keto-4-pentenoate hydratase/2-oxohepta-3-ene-1,7-dioic acid hydratase in catechol pathway
MIIDLANSGPNLSSDLGAILKSGDSGLQRLRQTIEADYARKLILNPEQLGPVIPNPGKVLCIGRNYADHAEETGHTAPTKPEVFVRTRTSLTGAQTPIVRPHVSDQLDYECELAVIIGRSGRFIARERALDYVAGYSIFNDISVRDFQFFGEQWTPGKNFDGTGVLGPFLVTSDEVPDPHALEVSTVVIGTDGKEETLQSSNTSLMVHKVPDLIAYISLFTTLEPGDVIATGTPAGVAMGRKPPRWLVPGETVVCRVEGLGETRNPVVQEAEQNP